MTSALVEEATLRHLDLFGMQVLMEVYPWGSVSREATAKLVAEIPIPPVLTLEMEVEMFGCQLKPWKVWVEQDHVEQAENELLAAWICQVVSQA
jgi:hypothetical protein